MVETLTQSPSLSINGAPYRQDSHAGHPGGRQRSSAEMLRLLRPLLPACGITRLANITGLDRLGVPVALAIRPNGKTLSTSAGKGLTLDQAFVSAAMEACETAIAENVAPDLIQVTAHELERQHALIDPQQLPLRPYAGFQPAWPRDWLCGWDLMQQCSTAVPLGMVRMGSTQPDHRRLPEPPTFQVSSNGLASGGSLLEATFAALLEIVERDAVERNAHHQALERLDLEREAGNPASHPFAVPVLSDALGRQPRTLAAVLQSAGLRVFALRLPSMPRTSVVKVFLVDERDPSVGVYHGTAAALSAHQALRSALLEAIQSRAVYIAGSRDDYSSETHTLRRRSQYSALFTRSLASLPLVPNPCEDFSTGTLHGDIHALLTSLRASNLRQAILLDLSPPSLPGIHVAKLVVPGMRGPTAPS